MAKLLEINDLTAGFKSDSGITEVLQNVSLHLQKGQTLAIVGESGSGKSVTSLHIMGLLPSPPAVIKNGSIHIEDVDVFKMSRKERARFRGGIIAMIFQEPMTSLNPVKTCGAQVVEMLSLHTKGSRKTFKNKTLELFTQVELPDPARIFDSYPHQLSGGQRQRVVIAMAISCEPKLLIADEPTTALDVTVQKSILTLLQKIKQTTHMGVVFITHDLGVVKDIADFVVVMYKGEIVESGAASDVLDQPRHPYTRGLLACRPPLHKRPLRLPTIADFIAHKGAINIAYETRDNRHARHKLLYANPALLKVENLSKTYHRREGLFKKQHTIAVDHVNFEVYPGETLGLVGESGCGKTTLSRCLLRLITPDSGKILFDGQPIHELSPKALKHIRQKVQIIFQDPYSSLNPKIKIGTAITEVMKVHGIHDSAQKRIEKTKELLEKVGLLPEHFERFPHEFSGGQRQRIVIARTLAVNPALIICDESVSALDVSVQAQVLNLLNDLKESMGLTYIFISHDLSVVKYMSDRIMVMKQGKVEELGEADELCSNPKSLYTRNLLHAIPGNTAPSKDR